MYNGKWALMIGTEACINVRGCEERSIKVKEIIINQAGLKHH